MNRTNAIGLNIRRLYTKHIIALTVEHLPVENILLMYTHSCGRIMSFTGNTIYTANQVIVPENTKMKVRKHY